MCVSSCFSLWRSSVAFDEFRIVLLSRNRPTQKVTMMAGMSTSCSVCLPTEAGAWMVICSVCEFEVVGDSPGIGRPWFCELLSLFCGVVMGLGLLYIDSRTELMS